MNYYIQCESGCSHVIRVKSPNKKTVVEDLLPLYEEHIEEVHPQLYLSETQIKDFLEKNVKEEKTESDEYSALYS